MARDIERVRVTVNRRAVFELAHGPDARKTVTDMARDMASALRADAPVRTGAGRASIRSEAISTPEGWVGVATWDERHYYLGILNSRTKFAENAFRRVRFV